MARLRGAAAIESKVASILDKHRVSRHLKVKRIVREEDRFKQTRRGQPGPDTDFKRITKRRFGIEWRTDEKPSPTITRATAGTPQAARAMRDSAGRDEKQASGEVCDELVFQRLQNATPANHNLGGLVSLMVGRGESSRQSDR